MTLDARRTAVDPGAGDARHIVHDTLLIAAYAAGDAAGADLARAVTLVASCAECAQLHRDLRALSVALAVAPAPARPRDLRLTVDQASALRRGAWLRRLLAPLAGASSAAGPVAASLAALGLAGLLLSGGIAAGGLSLAGAGAGTGAVAASAPGAGTGTGGGPRASGDVVQGAVPGLSSGAAGGGDAMPPETVAGAVPSRAPGAPGAPPAADGTPSSASAAPTAPAAPTAGPSAAPSAAPLQVRSAGPSDAAWQVAGSQTPTADRDTAAGGSSSGASAGTETPLEIGLAPSQAARDGIATASGPEPGGGPPLLALGSLVLLAAGVAIGLLRLAARRLG